jgi:hypothetical protein
MSSYNQHWKIPQNNLQLPVHEVHNWRVSLEASDIVMQYLERLLSMQEVTNALCFHFEKDRKHWIVAHGIQGGIYVCDRFQVFG